MTAAAALRKATRGIKRRCVGCDAPFYDLLRYPIQCPKCGMTFNADAKSASANSSAKRFKATVSRTRARAASAPEGKGAKPAKLEDDRQEADDDDRDGEDLILDPEDDET